MTPEEQKDYDEAYPLAHGPKPTTPEETENAYRTFGVGGYGNTLVYGNNPDDIVAGTERRLSGTSGAAKDANRFGAMTDPFHANGPQIDRMQSNRSRVQGMDALGMLRNRAEGGVTPAQQLAGQQTAGAVDAVQSGAASIKGGAMARAAASRGAVAQGARIQATGDQDQAALAARERADAAGQYMDASSAQRGTDLGLATDQAKLNADQAAANDQRNQYYEDMKFGVKKADLNAKLGRTTAEVAAEASARQQATAAAQTTQARTEKAVGTVTAVGTGALAAANKAAPAPTAAPKPAEPTEMDKFNNGDPNSDPRTKTNVRDVASSGMETKTGMRRPGSPRVSDAEAARLQAKADEMFGGKKAKSPVSDREAARLKLQADGMLESVDAQRSPKARLQENAKRETQKYDGKYLPSAFPEKPDVISGADKSAQFKPFTVRHDDGRTMTVTRPGQDFDSDGPLDAAMKQAGEGGNPYATAAVDPKKGYADSRKGQAGYMFGGAPEANYKDRLYGPDAFAGTGEGDHMAKDDTKFGQGLQGRRDIAMSDPDAKREAFQAGVKAGNSEGGALGPGMEAFKDYWKGGPPKEGPPGSDGGRDGGHRGESFTPFVAGQPDDYGSKIVAPAKMNKSERSRVDVTAPAEHRRASNNAVSRKDATAQRGDVRRQTATDENIDFANMAGSVALGPGGMAGGLMAAHQEEQERAAARPAIQRDDSPGYFGQLANQARAIAGQSRAMVSSDPKTKDHEQRFGGGPMAAANRSYEPSSYEYKDEFTPPEQERGEENIGPMADKMKADRVAGTAIVTNPENGMLAIDKTKGLKLALGGLSSLQRQVDKLERRRSA